MSSDKLTSAKRRKATGSQASLGMDNEMEMSSRPASAHSRNAAWSAENDVTDDIDFSPRAGATAVDVAPTGMEAEPVSHQKQIVTDVRAGEEEENVPVSCWTRFKRIVRSKFALNVHFVASCFAHISCNIHGASSKLRDNFLFKFLLYALRVLKIRLNIFVSS